MNTILKAGIGMLLLAVTSVNGQQYVKSSITSNVLPKDTASICKQVAYLGNNFDKNGYSIKDTVHDFTLYKLDGTGINLKTELSKMPVLLIAGSYTCPVYRDKVPDINNIVKKYAGKIKVYVIYTIEAHPKTDNSPYFGKESVTARNQQEKILYRQPTTYAQRKKIASDMLQAMQTDAEVLLDDPCNPYWLQYGTAPNNAYLISQSGIVFEKHGWFNKAPLNMSGMIDSLLGNGSGGGGNPANGTFSFKLTSSPIVVGSPGNTLYGYAMLKNTSDKPVDISISKDENNIPTGWGTAICTDICLDENVTQTDLYLNKGDSQLFTMYFYTSASKEDSGNTLMSFVNKNNANNSFQQKFYAKTSFSNSINEIRDNGKNIKLFPNPANERITVKVIDDKNIFTPNIKLFDIMGKEVTQFTTLKQIDTKKYQVDIQALSSGSYIVNYQTKEIVCQEKFVKY